MVIFPFATLPPSPRAALGLWAMTYRGKTGGCNFGDTYLLLKPLQYFLEVFPCYDS